VSDVDTQAGREELVDAAADELVQADHGELAASDHESPAKADDDELAEVERDNFEVITGAVIVAACKKGRKRTWCLSPSE